jgi:hypothetical protein
MLERVWRGRAPTWLRILTGILLGPVVWFAFALAEWLLFESLESPVPAELFSIVAGLASWVIVRKSSALIAIVLSVLALLALGWIGSIILRVADALQDVQ